MMNQSGQTSGMRPSGRNVFVVPSRASVCLVLHLDHCCSVSFGAGWVSAGEAPSWLCACDFIARLLWNCGSLTICFC